MKNKYKIIAERLITDSFQILQNKKIHIFERRFRFYALSAWIPPFIRFIIISTRAKDFTDDVLTGIIAHELCHQERYAEMGIIKYLRFALKYLTSKKAQTDEEKATDRLTIEKGYGKQLYAISEISLSDKNHKSIIDNYLSLEEIKTYAETIGKW